MSSWQRSEFVTPSAAVAATREHLFPALPLPSITEEASAPFVSHSLLPTSPPPPPPNEAGRSRRNGRGGGGATWVASSARAPPCSAMPCHASPSIAEAGGMGGRGCHGASPACTA